MGIGSILFLVTVLITVIVFIVLVVKTAGSWGVWHTVLLCLLFITSWTFVFMAAGVHHERVPDVKAAMDAMDRAEKAEAQSVKLEWGDYTLNTEDRSALRPQKSLLNRMTADRGRVWRQVQFMDANANAIRLQLPTAQDNAGAAAGAPSSESLPAGLLVYAFGEELTQVDEQRVPLPTSYLGEYQVSESQDGLVTLTPTLLPGQAKQRAESGNFTSWTLYELMPPDSHEAFAADGSSRTEENIFGNMDEESIRALFADLDDAYRDDVIKAYLADGSKATGNEPEENIWVQVNVAKPIKIAVDSADEANASQSSYFDPTGRAIDKRIKADKDGNSGGEIEISPDDARGELLVITPKAMEDLNSRQAGSVEKVQDVNVRPLNDYEKEFTQAINRSNRLDAQIAIVERDSQQIQQAIDSVEEMMLFRQQEGSNLQSDLDNIRREQEVLAKLTAAEEQKLASMQRQMNEWYTKLQNIHARRSVEEMSMLNN